MTDPEYDLEEYGWDPSGAAGGDDGGGDDPPDGWGPAGGDAGGGDEDIEEEEVPSHDDYGEAEETSEEEVQHRVEIHDIVAERVQSGKGHPWKPRLQHHSAAGGKRRDLTDEELWWMRQKQGEAKRAGLKNWERGPPPSGERGGFGRGQAWCSGAEGGRRRYRNRGGGSRDYYGKMAAAVCLPLHLD